MKYLVVFLYLKTSSVKKKREDIPSGGTYFNKSIVQYRSSNLSLLALSYLHIHPTDVTRGAYVHAFVRRDASAQSTALPQCRVFCLCLSLFFPLSPHLTKNTCTYFFFWLHHRCVQCNKDHHARVGGKPHNFRPLKWDSRPEVVAKEAREEKSREEAGLRAEKAKFLAEEKRVAAEKAKKEKKVFKIGFGKKKSSAMLGGGKAGAATNTGVISAQERLEVMMKVASGELTQEEAVAKIEGLEKSAHDAAEEARAEETAELGKATKAERQAQADAKKKARVEAAEAKAVERAEKASEIEAMQNAPERAKQVRGRAAAAMSEIERARDELEREEADAREVLRLEQEAKYEAERLEREANEKVAQLEAEQAAAAQAAVEEEAAAEAEAKALAEKLIAKDEERRSAMSAEDAEDDRLEALAVAKWEKMKADRAEKKAADAAALQAEKAKLEAETAKSAEDADVEAQATAKAKVAEMEAAQAAAAERAKAEEAKAEANAKAADEKRKARRGQMSEEDAEDERLEALARERWEKKRAERAAQKTIDEAAVADEQAKADAVTKEAAEKLAVAEAESAEAKEKAESAIAAVEKQKQDLAQKEATVRAELRRDLGDSIVVLLKKPPDGAYRFGLGTDYGGEKFVSSVDIAGPAFDVLYPDDVIDAINDVPVFGLTHREAVNLVKESGDEVKLSIIRDSEMVAAAKAKRASMIEDQKRRQSQVEATEKQRVAQQQQADGPPPSRAPPTPQGQQQQTQKPKKADSQKTLDAVTKLIQENDVTPQEAMVHAKLLSSVTVRKKGDAQRILLMNMVKLGNISIEDAMRHIEENEMTKQEETEPIAMPKGVWLNKKAELLGRSKMRYFTLFKTQNPERPGQFRYFEDADADGNGVKQKGFIDLRDVQQVTNDKEVLLIVTDKGRIFELVSEHEKEAALWSSFLRKELIDCGVDLPDANGGGGADGADGAVQMRPKKKKSMMSRLSKAGGGP